MTQPPSQPPNEPPQGGFGAPQDPPPGGFGAPPPAQPPQTPPPAPADQDGPAAGGDQPRTPPAQPGYGYPQTPPPGQPGYGYPQQPGQQPQAAPGYGFPQQPGQPPQGAPGYGYPGQPTPPYGQPPQPYGYPQPTTVPMNAQSSPGGGRRFGPQAMIITAAVVAIALIVGGGLWYKSSQDGGTTAGGSGQGGTGEGKGGSGEAPGASGGGEEKIPADPGSKVLFQLPAPKIGDEGSYPVKGSWLTGKVFAKPGLSEINGYDLDSGKAAWTTPLSGQHCASSPEIGDGDIAAVVYQNAKQTADNKAPGCDKISAIDLGTGEILWTESVEVTSRPARYDEVSISGSTVAVGGGTDGGAAFDLKTGKELWKPQNGDACEDVGYRGGEALVAVRKCGSLDNPKMEVQLLDASDGTPKWSYKLPAGLDNAKVISVDPVVFGTDSQEITASGVTDVFALDDKGGLQSRFPLEEGRYQHDCGVNKVHDCRQIFAGNGKLYVPTAEHDAQGEEFGQTNEILSFDLTTGKQTGDRFDAGGKYKIYPLRMDGENLLAYKAPPYDKGGQIVTIDPTSGKQTVLLENPAAEAVRNVERNFLPDFGEVVYGDGRLFMSALYIREPSEVTKEPEYLAIAFGTK
ncbi:outer membrane protein assembly factor BamB family protein [Streptomyces sp. BBFR102]|uniref:outer membrane protein assembly factor BamB family protein n=1 Tax=Streptomyces sp. BBFR102 TaxID=3448171 RepID=UPI003F53BB17